MWTSGCFLAVWALLGAATAQRGEWDPSPGAPWGAGGGGFCLARCGVWPLRTSLWAPGLGWGKAPLLCSAQALHVHVCAGGGLCRVCNGAGSWCQGCTGWRDRQTWGCPGWCRLPVLPTRDRPSLSPLGTGTDGLTGCPPKPSHVGARFQTLLIPAGARRRDRVGDAGGGRAGVHACLCVSLLRARGGPAPRG